MRLMSYLTDNRQGLAFQCGERWLDLAVQNSGLEDVASLLRIDNWRDYVLELAQDAPEIDLAHVEFQAPVRTGEKILCVGLNYVEHVGESSYQVPDYPVFFPRFASTLVGHKAPLLKPRVSDAFDYEGELVAVIGRTGRRIPQESALDHVAGYTIFNEGSVRDFQFKSPQWTMGKNFDGTGACGPTFVSADELPLGARGLILETRVNGVVEQRASTSDMMFDVATLVSIASEVMTLRPGDMLVTGTPSGVGFAKKPPVYLQPGDVCAVSIEGLGTLENSIASD